MIAWVEKQGEQKKSYDTCDSSMMDNKKSPYGEKRDFGYFEEKPADKVEPKFKIGDTVTVKPMSCHGKVFKGEPFKIVDIIEDNYVSDDGKTYSISLQDGWELVEQKPADKTKLKIEEGKWYVCISQFCNCIEGRAYKATSDSRIMDDFGTEYDMHSDAYKYFRLWTIQDAKDGDVLFQDLMGGKTFIYNGINPDMAILYSFIINNDGEDVLPYHIGKPNTGIGNIEENKNIIHPATKEQRDLLFQKMHEAGYEFDFGKKELKKIEFNSDDLIEESHQQQADDLIDMVTEKPTEWSDEDEKYSSYICAALQCYYRLREDRNNTNGQEELDKARNWLYNRLKSLKPQPQWKPSDEQMEALDRAQAELCSTEYNKPICDLIDTLNKLKG